MVELAPREGVGGRSLPFLRVRLELKLGRQKSDWGLVECSSVSEGNAARKWMVRPLDAKLLGPPWVQISSGRKTPE